MFLFFVEAIVTNAQTFFLFCGNQNQILYIKSYGIKLFVCRGTLKIKKFGVVVVVLVS